MKKTIQIGQPTTFAKFKELEVALFPNNTIHIIPFDSRHRAIIDNKFTLLDTLSDFLLQKRDFTEYLEDCSVAAERGNIHFHIQQKYYPITIEDVQTLHDFLEKE